MPEGQEPAPADGQEPQATESKEGQEPQGEPKGEPKTFDEGYVKSLRAEAARHRTEAQEAKAKAQEYEERDKSELEKLTGKLTKAEQAKAEAEVKLLRYEIATSKQLPAEALDLLAGSTREELEASADKILELVKNRNENNKPDFDGGPRDPAPSAKSPEQQVQEISLGLLGVPNSQ